MKIQVRPSIFISLGFMYCCGFLTKVSFVYLTSGFLMRTKQNPTKNLKLVKWHVSGESKDPVELQLALKVCRQDLTTAQEEFTRIKAEYWDVVPRRDWDALKQTHNQTLQQVCQKNI